MAKKPTKKRLGRPAGSGRGLGDGECRTVAIRLTHDQYARFRAAAEKDFRPLTDWLRAVVEKSLAETSAKP